MRHIPGLIAAAALVVSLGACSSAPAEPTIDLGSPCTSSIPSGNSSKLVTAPGDITSEPKVNFSTPLISTKLERSVVKLGEGRSLGTGDVADVHLTQLTGADLKLITSTWTDAKPVRVTADADGELLPSLLACATVGSRIAAIVPISLVNDQGKDGETIVVVIDVLDGYAGKAHGAPQLPRNGLPAVVLAPTGQPGIVIPKVDAPAELEISLLQAGDGETVAEGDSVVVHYTGMLWANSTIFDSSWDKGSPATLTAKAGNGGLVTGFATALIGQRVGSQVLVVIPPKDGYASGTAPATIPEGSTMVFVIDVLHIDK
ncbi:MAG: FKBP-type peptidyl-prolyl cis-trans isomerase [Microbacteriaceae bacterium]